MLDTITLACLADGLPRPGKEIFVPLDGFCHAISTQDGVRIRQQRRDVGDVAKGCFGCIAFKGDGAEDSRQEKVDDEENRDGSDNEEKARVRVDEGGDHVVNSFAAGYLLVF